MKHGGGPADGFAFSANRIRILTGSRMRLLVRPSRPRWSISMLTTYTSWGISPGPLFPRRNVWCGGGWDGGSVGGSLSLHLSHSDSEHDKQLSHAAHDVVLLTRPMRRDHDDVVIRLPPEGGARVGRATFAGRKVGLLGP